MPVVLLGPIISISPFNGGLTQVNTGAAQSGGNFAFINFMKSAQEWGYTHPPTDPTAPQQPILELDSDGYPTSIVAGTTGLITVLSLPNGTEYSGTWVLKWDGTGTAAQSGFSNTTTFTGPNRVEFTNTDTTVGGTRGVIEITATSAAPSNIKNLRLCRLTDESAMDGGQQFYPPHIAIMKSAKPGVIRSLGWGGGFNGTNDAFSTTWASRKPKTYSNYMGGVYNPNWWGGTTTNSGSDYTLAFGGFALSNRVAVQLLFNANTPQTDHTTVTYATTIGNPIQIVWTGHGLSANNAVALGTGLPSALTAATTYFIKTVVDANTFTVSATRGGAAINASANASSSCSACSIPMININSTGFVGITPLTIPTPSNPIIGFSGPQTGTVCTLVYDSALGYFHLAIGNFVNGVPPEVFADYCAAIGSHPHLVTPFLSVEPLSDYMTSWVTYIKNTYPWMKPRVEPPNECWNPGAAFLSTYYADALGWVLWAVEIGRDNTYGKWCSVLGQAISAIYGNNRTKYSMICSIQAASAHGGSPSDARLKSTLYVSQNGGDPAYKWVDRVCAADYYSPAERFTCQELIDAYAYSVTDAGNPTAQDTIANNYAATASVATGDTPFTLAWMDNCFTNLCSWAKGMPVGNTIAGVTCYEGGWSPDYLGGNWSTNITGATKANPCVLTLATTSQNSEQSGMSGNPAVVGMQITFSGFGANFTGTGSGTNLTVSAVTGTIVNGQSLFGTGVPGSTTIVSQTSGTTGGAGVYVTSNATTSSGAALYTGVFGKFEGQTVNITGVSGNLITTNLDASAQSSAFSGSALATYVNSMTYTNTLRLAGGNSSEAGTLNTAMYALLAAHASPGFVAEYPSNFLYFGTGSVWPVLQPDIYAPLTPQWNSIVAYN